MSHAAGRTSTAGDEIERAMQRLLGRMRRASDPHPLHLEMLEDDLREGLGALGSVQEFFDGVVGLLSKPETRLSEIVDLADDPSVLERIDYLTEVVGSVRRRLLQLAAKSAS